MSAMMEYSAAGAGFGQPTFVRLAILVRGWWPRLLITLAAALCNQGSGIALAAIGALMVARVAGGARGEELTPYILGMVALALGKAVFQWLEMWFAHQLAYGMLAWLRSSAYHALEPLAPAYPLKRRTGHVVPMA